MITFSHSTRATLAGWRDQGTGPSYGNIRQKINHFPIRKRELKLFKGFPRGRKEVMQSTAVSHKQCNISNDLQADRLISRLESRGWHLLGSPNSVVQGHFHTTPGKAESTRETLLFLWHFLSIGNLRDRGQWQTMMVFCED